MFVVLGDEGGVRPREARQHPLIRLASNSTKHGLRTTFLGFVLHHSTRRGVLCRSTGTCWNTPLSGTLALCRRGRWRGTFARTFARTFPFASTLCWRWGCWRILFIILKIINHRQHLVLDLLKEQVSQITQWPRHRTHEGVELDLPVKPRLPGPEDEFTDVIALGSRNWQHDRTLCLRLRFCRIQLGDQLLKAWANMCWDLSREGQGISVLDRHVCQRTDPNGTWKPFTVNLGEPHAFQIFRPRRSLQPPGTSHQARIPELALPCHVRGQLFEDDRLFELEQVQQ